MSDRDDLESTRFPTITWHSMLERIGATDTQVTHLKMDIEGYEAPTDEAVDARRVLGRCEQVIAEDLTPLQRRIFHLKHLRQQPIRSIANALGKSEDAVKANLYRMRRAISAGTPGLEGLLRS